MFIASRSTSWKGVLFTAISAGLFLWLGAAGYWLIIGVIMAVVLILFLVVVLISSNNSKK